MLAQRRSGMRPRKAWGATTRAMDALVLASTGDEPERTAQTSTEPRHLEGWTGMCDRLAWWPDITPGRGVSTVTASTWASASLCPRLSAGSEKPPSISMTLSV